MAITGLLRAGVRRCARRVNRDSRALATDVDDASFAGLCRGMPLASAHRTATTGGSMRTRCTEPPRAPARCRAPWLPPPRWPRCTAVHRRSSAAPAEAGKLRNRHRHRRAPHREHQGRAHLGHHAAGRDARRAEHRRPGHPRAGRPRAEPEHRIVVRPRLPALLHPRLRQHRLRPQRLAAGLAGLRRRGAGKPDPQGLPGVRPRAHRSAARPAGHAVRPQHAGRRGQVRLGQAGAEEARKATAACRSAPTAPSTSKARVNVPLGNDSALRFSVL